MMEKFKLINGEKYSRSEFDGYKLRLVIDINPKSSDFKSIQLYTTQTNRDTILNDVEELTTDKVTSFEIVYYSTIEQDILLSKFIDETVKEF